VRTWAEAGILQVNYTVVGRTTFKLLTIDF